MISDFAWYFVEDGYEVLAQGVGVLSPLLSHPGPCGLSDQQQAADGMHGGRGLNPGPKKLAASTFSLWEHLLWEKPVGV